MNELNTEKKRELWEYAKQFIVKSQSVGIDGDMAEALARYVYFGIMPGSFLAAVLENNLKEAVFKADHRNKDKLREFVIVLYNYVPAEAWGSAEKVTSWLENGGIGGK